MKKKKREILFDIPNENAPGYLKRQIEREALIARILGGMAEDNQPTSYADAVHEVVDYLIPYLKKEEDAEILEEWFVSEATFEDIEYILQAFSIFLFGVQPKREDNSSGED